MDNHFQWPPVPPQHGQRPQNSQNGQYNHLPAPAASPYPSHGGYYMPPHTQQPVPQQYLPPQSQPNHPIVLIPRPSQQQTPHQTYPQTHHGYHVQPRPHPQAQPQSQSQPLPQVQPRVMVPSRTSGQIPFQSNPDNRQGQVPAQTPNLNRSVPTQIRTPQGQQPQKPLQRPPPLQENLSQPQHRLPSQLPAQNRTPLQQHSASKPRAHPQVVIQKPAPHTTPSSTVAAPPPKPKPPNDYSVILLATAEEYIAAAYKMGPSAVLSERPAELQQYYKLIATALRCMEVVLKNKIQPRAEGTLRLKYAGLLVEETDDNELIEDVLTKGVAFCQRYRLTDLKYSMQHLQARFLSKTGSHRQALKSLDSPLSEAETLQHTPWVYAFRFLKASIALQVPGHPETQTALHQLQAIATLAQAKYDRAIYVTCSAFEAMVYLRMAGPENIEHAQRAIAAARSQQLQTSSMDLDNIMNLINVLDLICSMQKNSASEMKEKRRILQQACDKGGDSKKDDDGTFSVPLEKTYDMKLTELNGRVFNRNGDGQDALVFTWLTKRDVYIIGYYLSAFVGLLESDSNAMTFINEGIKVSPGRVKRRSGSVPDLVSRKHWARHLEWQMQLLRGLLACNCGNYVLADKLVAYLGDIASKPPLSSSGTYKRLLTYFSGVLAQTKGQLNQALSTYQLPILSLPATHVQQGEINTDITILATMNQILILCDPNHPQHFQAQLLFSQLEPLCIKHPNQNFGAALALLRVLVYPRDVISTLKTGIQTALTASKRVSNNQIISMSFILMYMEFFASSFGEQANKSVKAARSTARESGRPVLQAVAAGLMLESMRKHGQFHEVEKYQSELEALEPRLPPPLRNAYKIEDQGMGM